MESTSGARRSSKLKSSSWRCRRRWIGWNPVVFLCSVSYACMPLLHGTPMGGWLGREEREMEMAKEEEEGRKECELARLLSSPGALGGSFWRGRGGDGLSVFRGVEELCANSSRPSWRSRALERPTRGVRRKPLEKSLLFARHLTWQGQAFSVRFSPDQEGYISK